jgi:hypothetical protein
MVEMARNQEFIESRGSRSLFHSDTHEREFFRSARAPRTLKIKSGQEFLLRGSQEVCPSVGSLRSVLFRALRRRKLVLTQQVEPENRNERLDADATPPVETSSLSGATLSVWKKTVWCSCEAEPGSRVAAVGSPGESTKS